jgi:hypothetical protein
MRQVRLPTHRVRWTSAPRAVTGWRPPARPEGPGCPGATSILTDGLPVHVPHDRTLRVKIIDAGGMTCRSCTTKELRPWPTISARSQAR